MPKKKNTNQEQHDLALGDEIRTTVRQTHEEGEPNTSAISDGDTSSQAANQIEPPLSLQVDVNLTRAVLGEPVGGLENMESSLGQIKHAVSRAITERDILYSFVTELDKCITIIYIRVGILLLFLKAHLAKGEFQKQAEDIFSGYPGRKRRHAIENAVVFLACQGVKIKADDSKEVYEQLVTEWTASKIIDACGAPKLKSANPPESQSGNPPQGSDNEADSKVGKGKEAKSKFLRIDTFRQNAKRLGFASAKILESFKRLKHSIDLALVY